MLVKLEIDDDLYAEAKKASEESSRTIEQVIEDALRLAIEQQRLVGMRKVIKLHTCGGNGLRPGIDISSNAALEDLASE